MSVNMRKSTPATMSLRPMQPQYRPGNLNVAPWMTPSGCADVLTRNNPSALAVILAESTR
jgi:hypothetical protein